MHRHDLDLIAEYASGGLEDEARARSLVSACDICAAEYQLHSDLAARLGELGISQMTDHERAELHRDLWTELTSGSRRAAKRSSPAWVRWSFGTAAVIILVVGSFAVLSNMGRFDQVSETSAEIGGGQGSAGSEEPRAFGDDNVTNGSPLVAEDGGESVVDTTEGASESPDQGAESADLKASYLAAIQDVRKSRSAAPTVAFSSPAVEEEARDCLIQAGLDQFEPVGAVDQESEFLLAIPTDLPFTADTPIVVVDPATCEVLHTDE